MYPRCVSKGRALRRVLVAATAVVAGLVASTVVPATPAAAAVNQIALAVLSDGTAPFDSLDSGPANGLVRTRDVLTYGWTYSSDSAGPGSVTFVQTLNTSPRVTFDASNLAQCTGPGAGQLSADGHTLTCSVAVDATGAGTVPITITVDGSVPNGTVINSTLAANGGALAGGSRSTTVVAVPQLNLQANLFGTPTPASVGGATGSGYAFSFTVTRPVDAKGTELVTAPLTFTADLSTISPNAVLVSGSCAPVSNGGYGIPYGRIGIVPNATASNSVVNSGTVSCGQTGRIVTVTITGADLAGSSNPTTGAQGNQLAGTLQYLVSGTFTVFVPSTDSTSPIQSTIQYRGFDPFSITGQSNFGAGYEPGGDPSAATCTFVADNANRTNDNCFSTTFGPRAAGYNGYFWTTDTPGGIPAGGATNGSAGNGVASPGQTYYDRLHVYSTSGPPLTGAAICDKWNPAETRIVGVGRAYRNNTVVAASEYTVEYAVLPMPDDNARRATSCGTGTWYGSVEAAGGASVVNAVRLTPNWTIVNGETAYFHPQFQVQPNPVGTIIANFDSARLGTAETWGPSFYNRVTNNPSYTGNRLTVTDGVLRVTQTNGLPANQQFIAAGSTVTYTLTPTVTRPTSATSPVGGVQITDTLPACLRYVAGSARYVSGSASLGVELTAANNGADGIPCTGDAGETGPSLLLKLGPIVPNGTIPAISFQATALRITPDNTAATNTAVISSDAAVPIDLSRRTTSNVIAIRNQTQLAVSETTSTPQVIAGDQLNFTLAYRNVSGLTVPSVVLLTELPYNGDGRSAFTGSLAYAGSTAPAGVTVQCTNQPHGTITDDPANYSTAACGPTTTALRIVITNLANATVDAIRITLTPSGNATGDRYVNSSTGSYVPGGTSTPVALPATELTQVTVVSSTISGRTWRDANADGIRQSGEVALPGFPVSLSGTNDLGAPVSRSTTTAAGGTYSFTGLRAGSYTVTFSPAALAADQRFSPRAQGADRGIDSDGDPDTGATAVLTLGTGASLTDVDQGVRLVPPTVTVASSSATTTFGDQVTLTADVVPAAATGTVTFTSAVTTGPSAGSTVTLGTAPLAGGRATLTVALPAYGANTVVASYGGDSTYPAATSAGQVVQVSASTTRLLVSEFRLSGPGGPTDQYVELTNTSPFPVPLAGFVLKTDNGSPVTLPRTAPDLAPGRAYLVVGGGYSLSALTPPDLIVTSLGTTGGVRVTAPDAAGTVTDAAGPSPGYSTGTPLPALTGQPTDQYAWVRLAQTGTLQNSRNNAADFKLVSRPGGLVGGVQSTLGSASPSSTASPVRRPSQLVSTLIDPATSQAAPPNRVVTPGSPRTLTVRRTITNNTGATVASARLRIISISAANGAPKPGVPSPPPNPAHLRAINSSTPVTAVTIGGRTVLAHSVTLEPPVTDPPGGGLNSTLTVPLPSGGLAAGESISVSITFAVDRGMTFWFTYDVEI